MLHDLIVYTPLYVTFFWALVLLLTYRQKNRAKHFLGYFMIVASVLYLCHAIFFNKYYSAYIIFEPIYVAAMLSVYPMYFWYIKLLTVETRLEHQNLWKLFPALFFGVASATVYYFMSPDERRIFIDHYVLLHHVYADETLIVGVQKWIYRASRMVFAAQVVFFLVYGSRLVMRYNERIANFYSNLEEKTIVWVHLLLLSFVVTSIISMIFNIIGKGVFMENQLLLLIPSAIFSVLLFFIGFQGYMQNHTVADLELDELQSPISDLKRMNNKVLREKLVELFEHEAVFKQQDLKITHVSALLQTNRTYVSNLINTEFSCTFNDFVNQYRLEYAKQLLAEEASNVYSLDYIAEKSGFGSLSTFIRVFRDSEKTTPGRFRNTQIKRNKGK